MVRTRSTITSVGFPEFLTPPPLIIEIKQAGWLAQQVGQDPHEAPPKLSGVLPGADGRVGQDRL